MKVNNKICVVTGGLSGLGLATTKRLLELGARVAVIDLNDTAEFDGYDPSKFKLLKANVADSPQVARSVKQIVEWSKSSGCDLAAVICCAGLLGPAKIIARDGTPMALEHFSKVISVSLTGTVDVIRQLLPQMSAQSGNADNERGVVITVSSAAAFDGQPGQIAYSAAKGAIASMTLPLARDLASRGIRAVCIAPGMFDTNMVAGMPPKALKSLERVLEFPARPGSPSEFAALVEHIIGNVMLNGTVIRLDGATRMPSRL